MQNMGGGKQIEQLHEKIKQLIFTIQSRVSFQCSCHPCFKQFRFFVNFWLIFPKIQKTILQQIYNNNYLSTYYISVWDSNLRPLENESTAITTLQCDQMVTLFVQCLVIYNKENLHNSIKIAKLVSNCCPILTESSPKRPKVIKCSKSGEFSPIPVTLLPLQTNAKIEISIYPPKTTYQRRVQQAKL